MHEPAFRWLIKPDAEPVLLLGAFDPPTLAHLSVVRAAAEATGMAPALVLTTVLLDRPGDHLLSAVDRVELLAEVCHEESIAFGVANRGTYLEVARSMDEHPVFVIGSDKLPQLQNPAFYPDGLSGVEATFAECRFVVVGRSGVLPSVGPGIIAVLDPAQVFARPDIGAISASEVRRRLRTGIETQDFVPPAVSRRLGGYTLNPDQPR